MVCLNRSSCILEASSDSEVLGTGKNHSKLEGSKLELSDLLIVRNDSASSNFSTASSRDQADRQSAPNHWNIPMIINNTMPSKYTSMRSL